jgi:hypothetical protein
MRGKRDAKTIETTKEAVVLDMMICIPTIETTSWLGVVEPDLGFASWVNGD